MREATHDEAVGGRRRSVSAWVDRALWSAYSRVYDGLLSFVPYQNLLRLAADEADLGTATRLLDAGCGTGNFLALAARENTGLDLVGVDASPAMLRRSAAKLRHSGRRVEVFTDDVVRFLSSTPTNAFDRLVSINVLYALPDRELFWREALRVLAPGGIAVVTTSTRGGSASIVREHLDQRAFWTLLRPRLLGIFVVDAAISALVQSKHFSFPSEATLVDEVARQGGVVLRRTRCYGNANVMLTVRAH
jgi:SAM-dependent methyltransferase